MHTSTTNTNKCFELLAMSSVILQINFFHFTPAPGRRERRKLLTHMWNELSKYNFLDFLPNI